MSFKTDLLHYINFRCFTNNPKNLEHITRIFFNQKRKMIKKPLKILFKNNIEISNKLGINLNLRPQNLPPITYFKLCEEYENLSK